MTLVRFVVPLATSASHAIATGRAAVSVCVYAVSAIPEVIQSLVTTDLRNGDYAHIFQMDADFSRDPHHLSALRDALNHADVMSGFKGYSRPALEALMMVWHVRFGDVR
jgi:hypothetical protein